jgi:hypothetical protein
LPGAPACSAKKKAVGAMAIKQAHGDKNRLGVLAYGAIW